MDAKKQHKAAVTILRDAGVGEKMARSLCAGSEGVSSAVAAAAVQLAGSRRPKNLPGLVVSLIREMPDDLAATVRAAETVKAKLAGVRAAASGLEADRQLIANANPAAVWCAIPAACEAIKREHPSATPDADYASFRSAVADDLGELSKLLPPMHLCSLAASARKWSVDDE